MKQIYGGMALLLHPHTSHIRHSKSCRLLDPPPIQFTNDSDELWIHEAISWSDKCKVTVVLNSGPWFSTLHGIELAPNETTADHFGRMLRKVVGTVLPRLFAKKISILWSETQASFCFEPSYKIRDDEFQAFNSRSKEILSGITGVSRLSGYNMSVSRNDVGLTGQHRIREVDDCMHYCEGERNDMPSTLATMIFNYLLAREGISLKS